MTEAAAARWQPPSAIGPWQRALLGAVWLLAAVPVGLWLLHRSDPEAAVVLAQRAGTWALRALAGAGALLFVGALLFPPVPAWFRLRWHDLRLALGSDRGPLLRALGELQHFASAQRHFEVGRLALLRREWALAVPHLEQAIALEPTMAAAHHGAGTALFRYGQLAHAAAAFARAEQLDPGHAFGDALLHYGRCLDLLGQHDEAVRVLDAHAARHGGNCKSHYWLGQALAAAGDTARARAAFAAAAAPPDQALTAEQNWFRALARVRLWRGGTA